MSNFNENVENVMESLMNYQHINMLTKNLMKNLLMNTKLHCQMLLT
jgi:hypothetical protein